MVTVHRVVCLFPFVCAGVVVAAWAVVRFAPDWLLGTLGVLGALSAILAVVDSLVWQRRAVRRPAQDRLEREKRVMARFMAGTMDDSDLYQLVWMAWSPARAVWDETNGVVPYADGRVVRYCAFDAADRHYRDPDIGPVPYDPNVVARWVVGRHDPSLLVAAVRAGVSSDDLTAYMDDVPGFRATFGFMVSLGGRAQ